MKHDKGSAMRRVTDLVRSGNLGAATRLIQSSLAGGEAQPVPVRRSGLGRTLAELAERRAKPGPQGFTEPPLADGAQFGEHSYTCAAGSRDYRLYIPQLDGAAPKGLILMLHGCTQNPADFATGTGMNRLADQHGLVLVYPAQPRSANMNLCWNWFAPGDQTRDAGEPAILAGLTREIRDRMNIPHDRVFTAGLSAGAAMAVILGRTHPDVFWGVGAHSGLPYKAASDVGSAFAAMGGRLGPEATSTAETPVSTIIFHGESDTTVDPANSVQIADAGPSGVEILDAGSLNGRSFTRRTVQDKDGTATLEYWRIDGLGHAWSGGDGAGSYTDPQGPDASAEMVRFFLDLPRQTETG